MDVFVKDEEGNWHRVMRADVCDLENGVINMSTIEDGQTILASGPDRRLRLTGERFGLSAVCLLSAAIRDQAGSRVALGVGAPEHVMTGWMFEGLRLGSAGYTELHLVTTLLPEVDPLTAEPSLV